MKRILAGGLLTLSVFTSSAAAEDNAWAPAVFNLDNGMEVVVVPDHRAPVVTHMVWYKVGAVDEAPGKSGIAHLFEHVMFKETDEEYNSMLMLKKRMIRTVELLKNISNYKILL